jgi:hypothetical protein
VAERVRHRDRGGEGDEGDARDDGGDPGAHRTGR